MKQRGLSITEETLKLVFSDLETMAKKPKTIPLKDVIERAESRICEALAQGYTYADICEVLNRRNIKIAPNTLRQYLNELQAKREEQSLDKGAPLLTDRSDNSANDVAIRPQSLTTLSNTTSTIQLETMPEMRAAKTMTLGTETTLLAGATAQKKLIAISAKTRNQALSPPHPSPPPSPSTDAAK